MALKIRAAECRKHDIYLRGAVAVVAAFLAWHDVYELHATVESHAMTY